MKFHIFILSDISIHLSKTEWQTEGLEDVFSINLMKNNKFDEIFSKEQ